MPAPHPHLWQWLFSSICVFGGIIPSIWDAMIEIQLAIVHVIQAIHTLLIALGQIVSHILQVVFKALSSLVKKGFTFLQKSFTTIFNDFKKYVGKLYDDYQKFKAKLDTWMKPVMKVIQRVRTIYNDWWKKTVQPMLNAIHRVRMTLGILKFFHVGFAVKLDNTLAKVEGAIIHNSLLFMQKFNEYASFLELIVDPALLLRKGPFLGGFFNSLNGMFLGLFGRPLSDLLSGKTGTGTTQVETSTPAYWNGLWGQFQQGNGPLVDAKQTMHKIAAIPELNPQA